MAKRLKTYRVEALVKVWTEVRVRAESLDQALTIAPALDMSRFVRVRGDHLDSALEIRGVSDDRYPL